MFIQFILFIMPNECNKQIRIFIVPSFDASHEIRQLRQMTRRMDKISTSAVKPFFLRQLKILKCAEKKFINTVSKFTQTFLRAETPLLSRFFLWTRDCRAVALTALKIARSRNGGHEIISYRFCRPYNGRIARHRRQKRIKRRGAR